MSDFIADAVLGGVSLDAMATTLADVELAGLRFTRDEKRGVDVSRGPAIRVRGELVDGTFTETEARVSFSFWLGKAGGMKQTTVIGTQKRRDAAKVYAWVSANGDRLATMTQGAFTAEMAVIGARVD